MSTLAIDNLKTYGPERCALLDLKEAQAMCRGLAMGHYENFSVLSVVVPREFRDDFAALYAFCRWADDQWRQGSLVGRVAGHRFHIEQTLWQR